MIYEEQPGRTPTTQTAKHRWVSSPAATGAAEVCEQCGVRRMPHTERADCGGSDDAVGPVSHDYDPME